MYRRGIGQADATPPETLGPTYDQLTQGMTPAQIMARLNPTPNNPLSATGQSTMSQAALDLFSQLNSQYFGGSSIMPSAPSSFVGWLNQNSSYVVIGGAIVLAFLFFGGGRRR